MITELLERDGELDRLRTLLAEARAGRGGVVLVEAPAGRGKTALLRAVQAEAQLPVRFAAGAELEREFPFGLLRQLGSFDDRGPLALLVDDAHWGDDGGRAALSTLAERIASLPIALVIAARPQPTAGLDAFSGGMVLRPQPLSRAAVSALVAQAVDGEAEPGFLSAAVEATGGNPLLLRELRRTLSAEAFSGAAGEAARVRRAVPGTIAQLVQGRLWRLCPAAMALARAVAALGDRATPATAHALAGIDASVAASAHTALAAAGLLEPG